MVVGLRPIEEADQPFLERVYASTRAEELALVDWSDEQTQAFVAMQFAAQSAHYAQHYTGMSADVVLVDGEPAGRLLVARWPREIRIVDISLLPEHRGGGAGTALLRDVLAEGDREGKPVTIHVERGNRARELYERLGFAEIGDAGAHALLERPPRQVKTAS